MNTLHTAYRHTVKLLFERRRAYNTYYRPPNIDSIYLDTAYAFPFLHIERLQSIQGELILWMNLIVC